MEIECIEFNHPRCQYPFCRRQPEKGIPFCSECKREYKASDFLNEKGYGTKIEAHIPSQKYLSGVIDRFTDVDIYVEDRNFKVHRAILASMSDYFLQLFSRQLENKIVLKEVDAETFRKYRDFIYGKRITFESWREVVDFCLYAKITLLKVGLNRLFSRIYVPSEELIEYFQAIHQVYDNNIPITLISDLNVFYIDELDLSMFDERFRQTIVDSNALGPLRRIVANYYYNGKYNLVFDVKELTMPKCIGYYKETPYSWDDLTPELIKFCKDNELDIKETTQS